MRVLIPAGLAALAALPFLAPSHITYLAAVIASTSIIVAGLNVVTGLAGQISIAQASFAALGAYGTAQLASLAGLPHWIGLPAVSVATALVGYLFGLLSLRVADHYLALATMALCAIVQLLLIHLEDWTGGAVGLPVPPLEIGGATLTRPAQLYAVIMPCAVLTAWLLHALMRSRTGRAFAALRLSEVATPILKNRPEPVPEEEVARLLQPEDLAAMAVFVATLPAHVCLSEMLTTPTHMRGLAAGARKIAAMP